mmetsp:Transcript_109896/g.328603  ORF Transcript_109896/g.328603 Transcript_109896/m.328603 type:complete len:499 (+) Transcript_109896:70-1566(+)
MSPAPLRPSTSPTAGPHAPPAPAAAGRLPQRHYLAGSGPSLLRVVDQRIGRQDPVELLLRHLALHSNSKAQEQPRNQRQPAALREERGPDDERQILLLALLDVRVLRGRGSMGRTSLDAGEADNKVARDAAGQLVAREGDADAPLGRGEDGARLVAREADEPHGRVREGRDGPEGGRHRAVHLRRAEEQLREVAPLRDQARLVVAERHDSGRAGHVAPALRGGQPLSCHLADRRDLRSGCTAGVHAQAPIFAQLHARQPADAVHDGVGLAEEEHHIEGTAAIGPAVLRLDEELPVALSGARAPGLRGLSLDHPNEPGVEVRVHRCPTPRLHLLHQPGEHLRQVVLPQARVDLLQEPRDLGPGELAEGAQLHRRPAGAYDADPARSSCGKCLQEVLGLGAEFMTLETLSGAVNQRPLSSCDEVVSCAHCPNPCPRGVLQHHVQALLLCRRRLLSRTEVGREGTPPSPACSAPVRSMAHTVARRVGDTLLGKALCGMGRR